MLIAFLLALLLDYATKKEKPAKHYIVIVVVSTIGGIVITLLINIISPPPAALATVLQTSGQWITLLWQYALASFLGIAVDYIIVRPTVAYIEK